MVASRTANPVMDEFRWRGLIHITDDGEELYTPGLEEVLAGQKVTGYIGFDPSADSLHIGNLLGIMMLVRLQRHGHRPIAIAGGGTGLIGDPGGKSVERPLLTREELNENLKGIRAQLARFLDFDAGENAAMLINNADWLEPTGAIDFMRDVGKHFTVNYMLAKDSVQGRMADGITYTEFSYMLLQAYDYLTLYDRYGCTLQMGGSDQWGNITAGVHLIRRVREAQVHALVTPLVTSASGAKFGKTEAGAVWLDAEQDVAVPVLPVLAELAGRGRGEAAAVLHPDAQGGDSGAGADGGRAPGGPGGAAPTGGGGHAHDPRRGGAADRR